MKSLSFTHIVKSMVTLGVFAMLIFSCKKEQPDKVAAVVDRAAMPSLEATDVNTVISDSGITRYRIISPEWLVFDKAEEPYWDFPKGIKLEKFNVRLDVDATISGDYARYNQNSQIWELRDNVFAINQQGEQFQTNLLYWNQKTERIYSDSLITITRAASIIVGVGFESNQSMTRYTIRQPKGVFPFSDEEERDSISQVIPSTLASDSVR